MVVLLGERSATSSGDTAGATVPAVPLAIAVAALLLAIPMTYRPMYHLAGVVRQVGGYTVRVAQWMWVPVVMGLVGVASLVALRFSGVGDAGDTGAAASGSDGWVPLWVVAVVAIAPCVITILLAWRAARRSRMHRRGSGPPPTRRRAVTDPGSQGGEIGRRVVSP